MAVLDSAAVAGNPLAGNYAKVLSAPGHKPALRPPTRTGRLRNGSAG